MVIETLCYTDVSIPTELLDDVCSQFPGVPPDIAIRKMAIILMIGGKWKCFKREQELALK